MAAVPTATTAPPAATAAATAAAVEVDYASESQPLLAPAPSDSGRTLVPGNNSDTDSTPQLAPYSPDARALESGTTNSSSDSSSDEEESLLSGKPPKSEFAHHPWHYKAVALACALLMSIGSHYAAHTLGALKSTIKQEMDISNRQYGVLQSSVSVVNTIIPVLGGILIDAMGTGIGSLATTFLIVTGNALTSLSTHSNSFGLMVLGRVIYGLGSGTVTTAQETILGHWFMGRGLAITLAFQLASSRLASFLSMSTTVPIMRFFDNFYGAAFWAATFVCFLSFLSNLGYVALLKHIERTQAANEGAVTAEERARRLAVMKRKKRFDFRQMTILPFLAWTIIIQSFIIGSGCTTYLHILPELIKLRFGVSEEVASWEASMSQTIPIITMPFLGILLDKYGRRCTMIVLSAVLFTVSVSLLGFTDMQPIIGSLIFSFALTLGPLSEVSAIPLVVHPGALGTAYGLFKSAQNIGNTWVDVIIGHLQDIKEKKPASMPTQPPLTSFGLLSSMGTYFGAGEGDGGNDNVHAYDQVTWFFIGWGLLATANSLVMYMVDRRGWHRRLNGSSKRFKRMLEERILRQQQQQQQQQQNQDEDEDGQQPQSIPGSIPVIGGDVNQQGAHHEGWGHSGRRHGRGRRGRGCGGGGGGRGGHGHHSVEAGHSHHHGGRGGRGGRFWRRARWYNVVPLSWWAIMLVGSWFVFAINLAL